MGKTKILIRNIYLYLAVFVGLMMVAIPAGQMLKLGLETWVFPLAGEDNYRYEKIPHEPGIAKINSETDLGTIKLTEEEKQAITNWQKEYKKWEEKNENMDWKKVRIQTQASENISILLVGLVVFLSHGYVLKRDKKKNV